MTLRPAASPDRLRIFLASAFGLGLSPVMPGSTGALLGVAYHAALLPLPWVGQALGLALGLGIVSWGSLVLTPWAQRHWHHKDPSHFVLDEVAGYLLTVLLISRFLPPGRAMLFGFIAFRILDMIKIPPAWQIDRKGTGGWAILLDDYVSACYAAGLILTIHFLRTPK